MTKIHGYLSTLIAAVLMMPAPGTAADSYTVRCESHSAQYNECSVDGIGHKSVRLERERGGSRCVQGRNWGTSSRGIWVDDNCRGEFSVTNHSNSASNAGAVVAGAALLGIAAAAAAAANDDDHDRYESDRYDYNYDRYEDDREYDHHYRERHDRHHGRDGAPRFVTRSCIDAANDWVRAQRGGRRARFNHVNDVKRKNDLWAYAAYYDFYVGSRMRTMLAGCWVNDRGGVEAFKVK